MENPQCSITAIPLNNTSNLEKEKKTLSDDRSKVEQRKKMCNGVNKS